MKRLDKLFSALKVKKEKALVVYITAGDPDRESTLNFMHTLVDSGADILEFGFPFTGLSIRYDGRLKEGTRKESDGSYFLARPNQHRDPC